MAAEAEFMMPVHTPDAVVEMQIHALRQISDGLTQTNKTLASLATDVRDVRERVVKIEARDVAADLTKLDGRVEALSLRVDALERVKDRHDGAMGVGAWLSKNAAWLFAGIASFAAGLGFKTGVVP